MITKLNIFPIIKIFKVLYLNLVLYNNMITYKNITNGEISLNYDNEDKVNYDIKLTKITNFDSLDFLKRDDPNIPTSYYIESKILSYADIRSGSFSQISETYMKESSKQKTEE